MHFDIERSKQAEVETGIDSLLVRPPRYEIEKITKDKGFAKLADFCPNVHADDLAHWVYVHHKVAEAPLEIAFRINRDKLDEFLCGGLLDPKQCVSCNMMCRMAYPKPPLTPDEEVKNAHFWLIQKALSPEHLKAMKALVNELSRDAELPFQYAVDALCACRNHQIPPELCLDIITENSEQFSDSRDEGFNCSEGGGEDDEIWELLLKNKGSFDWSKLKWPAP